MWRTIVLLACASVYALGQTAGVQVNSTCEVGICGAGAGTIAFATASTPFNFTYTFANGDQYLITGSVSGTDNGNPGSENAPFVVEYIGPTAFSTGTDVLSVQLFYNFASSQSSQTFNETVQGKFVGTFGSGTSVTGQNIDGGNAQVLLGPFTPPSAFDTLGTAEGFVGLGNNLLIEFVRTYTFGAGSLLGAQITNGTASPVTPPPVPYPTITAVLDAGSYTPNIALGSVFVVKGSNLSASGFTPASFTLPPSIGGVSINFTPQSGGSAVQAYIVYLYNENGVNQLAAILPSTLTPGAYNVTVTSAGLTGMPFAVTVVASKPGLITQDATGNGLVVAQNYISASELDVNRFTKGVAGGVTISPAYPGQTLIAYLTGMGAVSGGDNIPSTGYDFTANGVNVQVYVGGMSIAPFYAGRTPGSAGLDQIDFILPDNVPSGCTVPFQVSENGNFSQPTFVSIAPAAGAAACVQAGYTSAQLQSFDNGAAVYSGSFSLQTDSQSVATVVSSTTYTGTGEFIAYTGFELPAIPPSTPATPPSGCQVTPIQTSASLSTVATGAGVPVDAGMLTLTGPSAASLPNQAFTETGNSYNLGIGEQGLPSSTGYGNGVLTTGTYTLTGAGGATVGGFNATVTLGTPFVLSLPPSVIRNSGLTLDWSGGNTTDLVTITGLAATLSGASPNTIETGIETGAEFVCYATAGQRTFTVSSSILEQLPAISAAQEAGQTGIGSLTVTVVPASGNGYFTAPLTAGGSIGNATFLGSTIINGAVVYQ